MNVIDVELKLLHPNFLNGKWEMPSYATEGSAAFDLLAAIDEDVVIPAFQTVMVPSGLSVWIKDPNYALMLMPRSGKGCKQGVTLGNSVGLLDSDYQGEITMCVYNRTARGFTIYPGEHIAQAMLVDVTHAKFTVVTDFSDTTSRGANGFGHTKQ